MGRYCVIFYNKDIKVFLLYYDYYYYFYLFTKFYFKMFFLKVVFIKFFDKVS